LMLAKSPQAAISVWLLFLGASCDRRPVFDGQRAFSDLVTQCSFGPRVAGTEAHGKTAEFLLASLRETTDICRVQKFSVFDSLAGQKREMTNIIASYYPDQKKRTLICAHWDSRPYSDQDPDSSKHSLPVPGANDGASGTALLLEIGRLLKDFRPPVGVDIVLFDGEDYGTDDWLGGWLMGSRYFVMSNPQYRPRAAILVDMIGDSNLQIYREALSQKYAGDLNDYIWSIASEMGAGVFVDSVKYEVSDDHVSLLLKGIKAIDIIDFDYPYWHTQQDTPDKCSPESLEMVGRVLAAAIYDDRITNF
jgi:glutaminyl-peptide cyclotransferase